MTDAPRPRFAGPFVLACCLLVAAAPSPHAADWAPAELVRSGDAAALAAFPESATAVRRMLAAAHAAQDAARIRTGLEALAAMGYAPTRATLDLLLPFVPEAERAGLLRRFAANGAPAGASRLYAEVPAGHRLVEGIASDPRTGRLFAATVVGRELLVLEHGSWRPVPGIEGGSLFGMAVDAPRRRLWLTSGVLEQTPHPETAFRGLIALDLDRLRVAARIPLPASPGDLTVAPDGTVYASDPVGGALFRLRPGARAASLLVPPGRLRSPQGLVVAPGGRRLYVADYGYGIGIVDLASGRIRRLAARGPAMLDGVDGMVGDRGTLIAIQNGVNPHRIVRLRLDRGGNEVVAVEPLERANPAWGEPSLGAVSNGELLYVADGQWERYGAGGAATGAARPTPIRALTLRAGGRLVEAGLHCARGTRVAIADQSQRAGDEHGAGGGGAARALVLPAGPRSHGFASHRTTFLTGFRADHRVRRPADECTMS